MYFVNLDPVFGHEQAGRRPVVVVSNDVLNRQRLTVLVVLGTTRKRHAGPTLGNVIVAAGEVELTFDTVFLTFQTRALDHGRFVAAPSGTLSPGALANIEQALSWKFLLPRQGSSSP